MKAMIIAALMALGLGAGAANAQSFSHEAPPHHTSGQYNWMAGGGG